MCKEGVRTAWESEGRNREDLDERRQRSSIGKTRDTEAGRRARAEEIEEYIKRLSQRNGTGRIAQRRVLLESARTHSSEGLPDCLADQSKAMQASSATTGRVAPADLGTQSFEHWCCGLQQLTKNFLPRSLVVCLRFFARSQDCAEVL